MFNRFKYTLILLLTSSIIYSCGDSHWHYEDAMLLVIESQKVMIETGYCKDEGDCTNKQLVFYRGYEKGIEINFYNMKDIELAKKIANHLASISKAREISEKVWLNFYEGSHGDNNNRLTYQFEI